MSQNPPQEGIGGEELSILLLSPFARLAAWIANRLVRVVGLDANSSPFAHSLSEDAQLGLTLLLSLGVGCSMLLWKLRKAKTIAGRISFLIF